MSKSRLKHILLNTAAIISATTPVALTCCKSAIVNQQEDDLTRTITLNGEKTISSNVYINEVETLRDVLSSVTSIASSDLEFIMSNCSSMFTVEYNKYSENSITYTPTIDATFMSEDDKYVTIKGEYTVKYNFLDTIKAFSIDESATSSINILSLFSDFFVGLDADSFSSVNVEIDSSASDDEITKDFDISQPEDIVNPFVFNFTPHGDLCAGKTFPLKISFNLINGQTINLKNSHTIWVSVPAFSPTKFFKTELFSTSHGANINIPIGSTYNFNDLQQKLQDYVDTSFTAKFNLNSEQIVGMLYPSNNSYFRQPTLTTSGYNNGFLLLSNVSSLNYLSIENYSETINLIASKVRGALINITFTDTREYASTTSGISASDPSTLSTYGTTISIDSSLPTPVMQASKMYDAFAFIYEATGSNSNSIELCSSGTYNDIYATNLSSTGSPLLIQVDDSSPSTMHFTSSAVPRQVNTASMLFSGINFTADNSNQEKAFPITLSVTPDYPTSSVTSSLTLAAVTSSANSNTMNATSSNSLLISKKISDASALSQTLQLPSFGTGLTNNSGLGYSASGSTPSVSKNNYSSKTWLFDNAKSLYSQRALDISNDLSYTNNFSFSTSISSVNVAATIANPAALSYYFSLINKNSISLRELYNMNILGVGKPSIQINGTYDASYALVNSYNNSTIFNKTLNTSSLYNISYQDIDATSDIVIPLSTNVGATSLNSTIQTSIPTSTLNYISFPNNNIASIQSPTESVVLFEAGNNDDGVSRTANVQNRTYGEWKWKGSTSTGKTTANSDEFLNYLKTGNYSSTYASYTTSAVRAGFANTGVYNLGLNNKPSDITLNTKINFDSANYGNMYIHFEDNNGVHYSLYDAISVSLDAFGRPVYSLNNNFKLCFDVKFYNPIREVSLSASYTNWTLSSITKLTSVDWYSQYANGFGTANVIPSNQTLADFCSTNWSHINSRVTSATNTVSKTIYLQDGSDVINVGSQALNWKNIFGV